MEVIEIMVFQRFSCFNSGRFVADRHAGDHQKLYGAHFQDDGHLTTHQRLAFHQAQL